MADTKVAQARVDELEATVKSLKSELAAAQRASIDKTTSNCDQKFNQLSQQLAGVADTARDATKLAREADRQSRMGLRIGSVVRLRTANEWWLVGDRAGFLTEPRREKPSIGR